MRNYEFFAARVEGEIPAFVKVLRAVPSDHFDYRPHEKSKSAGDLAWQLATEMASLIQLFDNGIIDYKLGPRPDSSEMIAEEFERAGKEVVARARATNETLWKGPAKFLWGGQVVWEEPAAEIAWGFLFDMVHHRGQLSTYLRPMGAKVPAIYGPSGDEQS
jgi:uncharacterized damage-inducible protein DinB